MLDSHVYIAQKINNINKSLFLFLNREIRERIIAYSTSKKKEKVDYKCVTLIQQARVCSIFFTEKNCSNQIMFIVYTIFYVSG